MPNKIITPLSLIGSIGTLATFAALLFAVDSRYVTAEAAELRAAQIYKQQQTDSVETDIELIELEIEFLESLKQDAIDHDHDEEDVEDIEKEIEYLERKLLILEKYQLELERE